LASLTGKEPKDIMYGRWNEPKYEPINSRDSYMMAFDPEPIRVSDINLKEEEMNKTKHAFIITVFNKENGSILVEQTVIASDLSKAKEKLLVDQHPMFIGEDLERIEFVFTKLERI